MKFKKICIFLLLIFSIFPFHNIFAQIPNVGFIPANIWYSKDPFTEGDKIKIFTLVYNPDNRELSVSVIFFDNDILLGKKDIKITAKSVKDVSIDWTVTAGDHVIFAKIENAKFLNSNGTFEEVYLARNQTEENKRNVSKKIISDLPNNIVDSIIDTVPISDVQKIIKDNTPVFITNAIDHTINSLEDVRTNIGTSLENKKEDTKKEIEILDKTKIITEKEISLDGIKKGETVKEKLKSTETTNLVLRPFKYVELFFLSVFSFIFEYKIVFYSLLVILLFLIIRYLWRLIF